MAKAKGKTETRKSNKAIPNPRPTPKERPKATTMKSFEPTPPTIPEVDQEMREILVRLGEIQAKYQQLGITTKSVLLRNTKRKFLQSYKEWNV